MRYFPLFLDLRDRRVLIVGGGIIAERKAELVRESGARLLIVAPRITERLQALHEGGLIDVAIRTFAVADVDGARLVVAATDDPVTNRAVADAANARGIFVNVVDDLELSTGILPAIVDRSPIVVAISTQGTTPALARFVRARIETLVDESFGRLATFCAGWRGRIKAAITDLRDRRRFYDWLLHGPAADLIRSERTAEAEHIVAAALADNARDGRSDVGSVALVGAGPGDPGLLTLRALRALQSADVVLHDRLVSTDVIRLVRREAEVIEVGKSGGGHSVSQARIHELMVEHARRGQRVVRLKGGDPFVFGRGGEELEYLRAHGIAYEVVPGITAALACAAYAGIPLTHRDHSASLRFVTAHCRESLDATDWRGLADARETLVVYMGVALLATLRTELVRHGRDPATPVALIENGSRPDQRVLVGTLAEVDRLATEHRVGSPTLLVIGGVAALARELHWFGSAPLTRLDVRERSAA